MVLGIEVAGRWSEEARQFVGLFAKAKARQADHRPELSDLVITSEICLLTPLRVATHRFNLG